MGGWFRKEIKDAADLKGLKMRIGGFAGVVTGHIDPKDRSQPSDRTSMRSMSPSGHRPKTQCEHLWSGPAAERGRWRSRHADIRPGQHMRRSKLHP
jgi:hypothetical protein